jgi:Fis family transcriptional regulator
LGAQKVTDMYDFAPDYTATESLVGLPVADVERDLILATLRQTEGNRTHAANILGISIRTMRNKLRDYADQGIPIPANH